MTKTISRKFTIVIIGIFLGVLGVKIGSFMYYLDEMEIISEGILGLVIFISFYILFLSPKRIYKPGKISIRSPFVLKILVIYLFSSIVLYRSFQYIKYAVVYIIRLIN
jgi:hypothetical protein